MIAEESMKFSFGEERRKWRQTEESMNLNFGEERRKWRQTEESMKQSFGEELRKWKQEMALEREKWIQESINATKKQMEKVFELLEQGYKAEEVKRLLVEEEQNG
jgi:ribosomal protein L20